MGFNKTKRRVRLAIKDWECLGFFGYGHGRAAVQFGEDALNNKSVCQGICKQMAQCKDRHRVRMDSRYPQLQAIVAHAAKVAMNNAADVNKEIVEAIERAAGLDVEEAIMVKIVNAQFGVDVATDHYRSGQFENIQNGIDRMKPTHLRPVPFMDTDSQVSDERIG